MRHPNLLGAGLVLGALLVSAGCNRNPAPDGPSSSNPAAEQPAPGDPGSTGSAYGAAPGEQTYPSDTSTTSRSQTRSTSGMSQTSRGSSTTAESNPAPAGRGAWEAPSASTSQEPGPARGTAVRSLPAGSTLDIVFLDDVSSASSKNGDSFRARVNSDVMDNGTVAIPSGSVVVGTVTEAVPLHSHFGGQSRLALNFDRLELPSGQSVPIDATFAKTGKSETHKDVATVLGGAVAGAVAGRIIKDKHAARIGAVIGAAAGTAVAMTNKGQEVRIPSGTEISLELRSPVDVPVRL